MNRLPTIFLSLLLGAFICGCTSSQTKVATSDPGPWNENVTEEVQDMTETGQAYRSAPGNNDDNQVFFTRNKPQIETVQIWLESSKSITEKITEYIKEVWPDRGTTNSPAPPGKRLLGKWYGIDRILDAAIIFTFQDNGDFSLEAGGKINTGKYVVEENTSPCRIKFIDPTMPERYSTAFEFIDDYALILKEERRDLILFKRSESPVAKKESA